METQASGLLSTLVVSLVAAFAGGLAARVMRLPPLLGYLLAGIALGPFTPGFVANQAVASELADIGVALLLFNIGLHFSLKELIEVRKIAVVGALIQMTITCALASLAAWHFLDCAPAAALMIGLSLSIASTAVSTRILEEKHQIATLAGRIAIGWLVVQDIAVIMAMVIFPAFVNSQNVDVITLTATIGKTLLQVAGFAVVMLFGVRKFIPRLLGYVARIGSRELFTLAVIVIALGIAYGSSILFGVSLALGAFFAGVVIGESDLNHHAAAEALSMQQVFTILFFVSVGMLFDPSSLTRLPLNVIASWVLIVMGMGLATFAILLALRVPPEAAALVGGAFAQIGEFSFVLSQLGHKWGILTQDNSDLILAVALISIVLNPLVMLLSSKLGRWLNGTPPIIRWINDGETHMPNSTNPIAGHVIIVGHGRVGQIVADVMKTCDIAYITIDSDRRLMEKLRKMDMPVIYGDATREQVLMAAHPETARMIIIALPHGPHVRRVITLAKHLNPSIEIIVRVHEDTEARHMARQGVGLAVMGEQEIALGLSAYALQHFGIESHNVLKTMNQIRQKVLVPNTL